MSGGYESHSFLYAAADVDLAGPAITLRLTEYTIAGIPRSHRCRCAIVTVVFPAISITAQ